ncbi:hypothetical protein BGZ47_010290 [Haplosporangium gracile]|nr:hypothetical protein BGZ47_010290 [Haplosporangium gracile]
MLTIRGSICILRTNGGSLSSSCSGNVCDETSYIEVGWVLKDLQQRQETCLVTRKSTDSVGHEYPPRGGFKPMLEEIKFPIEQFSLSATKTGGLVLRKARDVTTVWQLGGGLVKGKYTIELRKDGNLCVGTTLVHTRVSCITEAAKKKDQYVLIVENEGHGAILASDGSVAWRST